VGRLRGSAAEMRAKTPSMSHLPADDDLDLIHTRGYETRVYHLSDDELLVRGAVSDRKPPGLYVADDPAPLEMHRMQIELRITLPALTITQGDVLFDGYPNASCPVISDDYDKLVGLSIARGFSRRVRDLFGGPHGCVHVNALLRAMAPAVVQSTWSLAVRGSRVKKQPLGIRDETTRRERVAANANTCHIWSENGDHVAALLRGEHSGYPPLPVGERLRALGRDDDRWE